MIAVLAPIVGIPDSIEFGLDNVDARVGGQRAVPDCPFYLS